MIYEFRDESAQDTKKKETNFPKHLNCKIFYPTQLTQRRRVKGACMAFDGGAFLADLERSI